MNPGDVREAARLIVQFADAHDAAENESQRALSMSALSDLIGDDDRVVEICRALLKSESVDAARDGAVAERSAARSEPPPLTSGEIEELERLLERAMPQPWLWDWRYDAERAEADCGVYTQARSISLGHAYAVARCPRYQKREQWEADAELITKAVSALPRLLSSLKQSGGSAGKGNTSAAGAGSFDASHRAPPTSALVFCVRCVEGNSDVVHIFSSKETLQEFLDTDQRVHIIYDYVIDCPERMEQVKQ